MRSFRNELEDLNNPVVEKDIIDLAKRIELYNEGKIDPDKFRSLRLARGVYGQRQPGVQMIRIKIPFGRMTVKQMKRIADISTEYGSSNLHATTRQDIQIHYVSLEKTPELWAKLEQDSITTREACGNTVRNITASPKAGIDPQEPFDVSPYAEEMFRYFLRNPVCQEMGRKFKISFSSSDADTGISFIHDIGFIPKVKIENGEEKRGFRVMLGGGLGAQPVPAVLGYEFLEEDQIIPFTEAVLRVFDRHGERKRRVKARFKFLMNDIGLEEVMKLVKAEWKSLSVKSYKIDKDIVPAPELPAAVEAVDIPEALAAKYQSWENTNVFAQKQEGYFGVAIKLPKGDMSAEKAHQFADIVKKFAGDDIRVTVNQGYVLRYVTKDALSGLFLALNDLYLAEPGYGSTADVMACPGTDSCNLGVSDSTQIALELEKVIINEYPDFVSNNDIQIKISGCPNSCGQHSIGTIGFHGSSLKNRSNKRVFPALQVLLGGGSRPDGEGYLSEKVIKIPSKRGPEVLRHLLDDYQENRNDGEYYADYYRRQTKDYFYQMLKPHADQSTLQPSDYIDWGKAEQFVVETEVGECAGVIIDLVSTLLFEAEEKFAWAKEALEAEDYSDAIYHGYNTFINGAKALLTDKGIEVNTQAGVMNNINEHFADNKLWSADGTFMDQVLQINKNEPSKEFAESYIAEAEAFLGNVQKTAVSELVEAAVEG
ncbi:MAG: HEPN domain-containing protein [Cyclobacteriaceae bacterium]